ncbi:hypothetical protein [Herbaspirillum sp. meg3]|uniref:hypothetical protein n=1 Tax=Herbaspirillum sp. meg3 TaxID=2025949 RepID=UPI0012FE68C7|nr:hypothetical protein [Herbaspirillum sp. meg3]
MKTEKIKSYRSSEGSLTQLERLLASIRISPSRLSNIVIIGPPMIEKAFYNELVACRWAYYQGNTPTITTGRANAIKHLKKMAKRSFSADAVHALTFTMKRKQYGLLGGVKTVWANTMPQFLGGGRHRADIVVVGAPDIFDIKLKELANFIQGLEQGGILQEGVVKIEDGKFVVNATRPILLDLDAIVDEVYSPIRFRVIQEEERQRQEKARITEYLSSKAEHHSEEVFQGFAESSLPDMSADSGPLVNPATGLPMVQGGQIDVGGNTYGFDNSHI